MSRHATPLRLFVAARPPLHVAERLLQEVRALDLPPHRLTPPEQVHLTLLFIGPADPREVEEIRESVRRAAAGVSAARSCATTLMTLPRRGPRLVAAAIEPHPSLLEIHARLVRRLARRPRQRAEDRFLPHLTLCRFRTGEHARRIEQPIDGEPFDLGAIELTRSVLRPQGARHDVIERVDLDAAT
ncbi:MAG: RNA 2',3'-cyclic phosphodiesterase [Phycisphaerales bacterium]|nr:RNA 2',3'-cyclic phosphodiesterase [Phycisphaerales bacterium]